MIAQFISVLVAVEKDSPAFGPPLPDDQTEHGWALLKISIINIARLLYKR